MPSTIVAGHVRVDAMLERIGLHVMTDSAGKEAEVLRPSKKYFREHAGDGYTDADMDAAPPGSARATWLAWMHGHEQTRKWLLRHAPLYSGHAANLADYQAMQDEHRAYQQEYQKAHREEIADIADELRETEGSVVLAPETVLWWWEKYRLLQWDGVLHKPAAGVEPPDVVLTHVQYWYLLTPYPPLNEVDAESTSDSATSNGITPSLPPIPNVFKRGRTTASSNVVMLGAMAALHNGLPTPYADQRPSYHYKTEENSLLYVLDDPAVGPRFTYAPIADDLLTKLLNDRDGVGALDVDVLMAIDAHILLSSDGVAWISGKSILDYRGIQPRQHSSEERWRAGHRRGDFEVITDVVNRLDRMYVKMAIADVKRGSRAKSNIIAHESKLIRIDEKLTQYNLDGEELAIAWLCRHGTWRSALPPEYRRQTAEITNKVLEYDMYHEPWEKRIGQYVVMHQRVAAQRGVPLRRSIRVILERVNLPKGGLEGKHPERRIKKPFEDAINRLCKDGVIADCDYNPNAPMPARVWLGEWLDQTIALKLPQPIAEHYRHIPEVAQKERLRVAGMAEKRQQKGGEGDAKEG